MAPVLDFGLRLYLADVFIKSGLTKIQSWDSTLYLFSDAQRTVAAPRGGRVDGCQRRLGCLYCWFSVCSDALRQPDFSLNIVAVISYADLSQAGLNQHLSWGILLGVLLILSRNTWSADTWLEKRLK